MFLRKHVFLFLATCVVSLLTVDACNRTCGERHVLYPFGFDAGCPIRLNCSSKGDILVGEFPVQNISKGIIRLSVETRCNRSVRALENLFTSNYAPTNSNAIFLHTCNSNISNCAIPNINMPTSFGTPVCASSPICFIDSTTYGFYDYKNMSSTTHCKNVLSSIFVDFSSGSSALVVQVMVLKWWLPGKNCSCSKDATCIHFKSPVGPGYQCRCKDGLLGDGFLAGDGCRKDSSNCSHAKLLSGQCGGPLRYVFIIGGAVAGATLMMFLGLICCLLRKRSYSRAEIYKNRRLAEATGISISIYPYKEIEKATNGFSDKHLLGIGAFGTVYAGKLHNDSWVAIKRIRNRDADSIEQVMNEVKLISSVDHPNLVRLLGCCVEHGEQILVYEFMPNGTLCQHLQREKGDGLAWPIRLAIATETAQAIAHLHSAIDPPIYHRDIKSSNILLDCNFRSKVADFGLSRLGMTEISHISTAPQGTPGYLDPQYHQNFHLSDKSDVYSFGVVLVEIISALKVVDFGRPQNEVNLASLATDRIRKGRLEEIIDPLLDLHTDAWTLSSLHKVAELAFRCLAYHKDMRPSMMEVAAELEQIRICSTWAATDETNCTASSETSASASSDASEHPLRHKCKKQELGSNGLLVLQTQVSRLSSIEMTCKNNSSPVSVQDPWLSEQSSPSTSSLRNTVPI